MAKKKYTVNKMRCPQDHFCPARGICPTGAIVQKTPFTAPEIIEEKCTGCGKCSRYCPFSAFEPQVSNDE